MVYRMEFTYDEIVDIMDVKNIAGSTTGYRLAPGFYEFTDNISMLKSLLPKNVEVKITIDDFRLRSNLSNAKTIAFKKTVFSYGIRIYSISIRSFREVFIQKIPCTYESEKPINITGNTKNSFKL